MIKLKDILSEIKVSLPYPPKTIGWWLNQLPEPYRTQALTNWKKDFSYKSNKLFDSVWEAILQGFIWGETPEGRDYWADYYHFGDFNNIQEIKVVNPNLPKKFPIEITEENWVRISKYLDDLGYRWVDGDKLTEWNPFEHKDVLPEDFDIENSQIYIGLPNFISIKNALSINDNKEDYKNFPITKQYIDEIKINVSNLPKSPITINNHKEFLKLMELLLKK